MAESCQTAQQEVEEQEMEEQKDAAAAPVDDSESQATATTTNVLDSTAHEESKIEKQPSTLSVVAKTAGSSKCTIVDAFASLTESQPHKSDGQANFSGR